MYSSTTVGLVMSSTPTSAVAFDELVIMECAEYEDLTLIPPPREQHQVIPADWVSPFLNFGCINSLDLVFFMPRVLLHLGVGLV